MRSTAVAVKLAEPVAAKPADEIRILEEDGWIFREQPGKGIACLQRVNAVTDQVSPPYMRRHDYPSH